MKDKYPRIGRVEHLKYLKKCAICGQLYKATLKITIEYNYMRGDDDVLFVCPECYETDTKIKGYKEDSVLWLK